MKRLARPSVHGLLACCLGVACDATPAPQSPAQPAACEVHFRSWRSGADDGRYELAFTPDGTRLVIDGRWSFDPQSLEFEPIVVCSTEGSLCLRAELAFAPRGHRFSVMAGDRLAVGVLEQALEPFRTIPRWLPADADATEVSNSEVSNSEVSNSEVSNIAAWLDPDRLLIVQSYLQRPDEPVCRLLDLGTGEFHAPPGGCPRAGFSHLGSIEPGAPGVLMLHSSAEGASSEEIVRYTPEGGQEEPALASVTLQGWSAVSGWVAPDGERLGFISPCDLRGPSAPPCEEPERLPTKLYQVNPADGALRLLRDDLPPGSVRDPQRERFAWVADGALCIGDPGRREPRCAPLPASVPCR